MRDIRRSFGGLQALNGVSLSLFPGEIVGLLGENGAGKSTLVKILTGVVAPDSGQILIDGVAERVPNPRVARAFGIAATYQEPAVFPDLDVAENVFAGRQPTRHGLVDWREIYQRSAEVFAEMGVELKPHTPVYQLGIADRQLIEIAKSLISGARVLILDEPTSVLSSREVDALFGLLRSLRDRGISLVFVSHKLDEVEALTDRVAVLRDGSLVGVHPTKEVSLSEIVRMMCGREIGDLYPALTRLSGDVILEVKNLTRPGYFKDVSFSLRKGEILGLAGLVGAGRTELAEAIFGVTPAAAGTMTLDGYPYTARSPRHAVRCGIAYLPEDRLAHGLVMKMRVPYNMTMTVWSLIATRFGRFRARVMYRRSGELARRVQLQAGRLNQITNALSGGNQQKVVLGKWLATEPRILILDEPTHGIDIGTKSEVLGIVAALAASGVGVIFISSELEEVRAMSTRLLVMREGRVVAEFDTPVDAHVILEAASGLLNEAAQ
ncbi:MAG: sugar ABC transporter ATP-binding protein [Acidimicrobiales bacterium]|jgi:ABC-type sugar transport system ATPase subunit